MKKRRTKIRTTEKKVEEVEVGMEWEKPISFSNHKVKKLPDIFPDWLQKYQKSLVESTQTPSAMTKMLLLSAISTAVAGKGEIEVRKGYKEPLNIWTCTVLPPANRKSAVFRKIMEPILEYEEKLKNEVAPDRRHAIQKKEVLEESLKEIKKEAKKADEKTRDKLINKIQELSDDIEEIEVPALFRLIASDITTEKLAKLMEANKGKIAILSPEGDIFKLMAGRYTTGGTVNFENFKKAWTGREAIRDDRMGREGTYIKNPNLTMGLAVQPQVLQDLNFKSTFIGEGIIGRFLYTVPESLIGKRKTGKRVPELDNLTKKRYKNGLNLLLNSKPKEITEDNEFEPYTLSFSKEALNLWDKFDKEVEEELGEGDLSSIQDWGGKLVGNTIRVAGLIHLAYQVNDNKGEKTELWNKKISGQAMQKAIQLSKTLISHAQKIYEVFELDPEIELTKYVLKRIKKGKQLEKTGQLKNKFDGKEILDEAILYKLTRKKKEIKKPKNLHQPLKLLEELNYIKRTKQSSKGRGRPPSPKIILNPEVDTLNTLNTQKRIN